MKIRLAQSNDTRQWDLYVQRHPDASPYHLMGWRDAILNSYGHQSCYLLAEQEGQLVGVLPLVKMNFPLGGSTLCALPFCDVGYALADSDEIRMALELAAIEQANGKLEIRDLGRTEQQALSGKVRMLLPFPESADALWDSFKSKLRSQVRKAGKNGLTFTTGADEAALEAFYQVFAKNMRDLGSPVHSLSWFKELYNAYGDNMVIGLVHKDDAITGAGILLFVGDKVSIPWASTLRDYNHLAPNMLLYWNFLRISCERGCSEFDFGRSTFNEGTYRFKRQWGARPVALEWKSLIDGSLQPVGQVHAGNSGKVRRVIENAWSKLPLGLTIQLGPAIRKYISL